MSAFGYSSGSQGDTRITGRGPLDVTGVTVEVAIESSVQREPDEGAIYELSLQIPPELGGSEKVSRSVLEGEACELTPLQVVRRSELVV